MQNFEVEYKGYKIIFSEGRDEWYCNEAMTKPGGSLLKIKEQIDAHIKKETAFPRQSALMAGNSSWRVKKPAVVEVTVTSGCCDEPGSFWIINDEGKRRKERGNGIFLDCPENRERGKKLDILDAEINALKEKRDALWGEMTPFMPRR